GRSAHISKTCMQCCGDCVSQKTPCATRALAGRANGTGLKCEFQGARLPPCQRYQPRITRTNATLTGINGSMLRRHRQSNALLVDRPRPLNLWSLGPSRPNREQQPTQLGSIKSSHGPFLQNAPVGDTHARDETVLETARDGGAGDPEASLDHSV